MNPEAKLKAYCHAVINTYNQKRQIAIVDESDPTLVYLEKLYVRRTLTLHRRTPGSRIFLISGPSGVGKSTHLEHMAVRIAKNFISGKSDKVPVLLTESNYRHLSLENKPNLDSWLPYSVNSNVKGTFFAINEHEINDLCAENKVILLLDDFDKIAFDLMDYLFDSVINDSHNGINVVASGRYVSHFDVFETPHNLFELQPFKGDQVSQFITNWFNIHVHSPRDRVERIESLTAKINNNHDLQSITKDPLILSMVCTLHRSLECVPENKNDIVMGVVKLSLKYWEVNKYRNVRIGGDPFETKMNRLIALATNGIIYNTDTALKVLAEQIKKEKLYKGKDHDARSEANNFLNFLKTRTGLIVGDDAGFVFFHPVIQAAIIIEAGLCDVSYRPVLAEA